MLCGQDNFKNYLEIGQHNLAQCRTCGLIYLNPRPTRTELAELYGEEYFSSRNIQSDHSSSIVRSELDKRIPSAERIGVEVSGKGAWLDVGCGSGYLLAAAKELGWSVQGVEISSWAAEFAMHSLNVPTHIGTLVSYREETKGLKFNIITLMAYLEHSHNPIEDLRIVSDMLVEGGVAVIRVPNVSSFDRYWHGPHWWGWHLPFHLYHFSPWTLRRALAASGLQPYEVEFDFWNPILHLRNALQYNQLRWDGPLEGRNPHEKGTGRKTVSDSLWWKSFVRKAVGSLLKGRDMIVYARKTS